MKLISLLFPFFLRKKKCNHSQLYTTLSISQLIFNDFQSIRQSIILQGKLIFIFTIACLAAQK